MHMEKLILVLVLFVHLLYLNLAPSGMTNDELHFVLNAKSVFLNFSNLANNWNPLSLTTIPHETSSELSFLFLAPIIGPLPTNMFTARLPLALLSVAVVYLLFLISQKLFNRKTALIIAYVAALNPWIFYVYRTVFDGPIAIFFLLLTLYLLLTLDKWLLTTLFPITAAFYSYIGTKVIVFPFVLIISIYAYQHFHHRNLFKLLFISFYTFLLCLIFFVNLKNSSVGQRTVELVTPWSPQIIAQVEQLRSQTFTTKITPVFTNKFTVYSQFVLSKWFNSFSPNLLFIKGDETFTGSVWHHGYFYMIDAVFIIFGLLFIYANYRSAFFLLISLLAISPIPEIIRKDQMPAYVFHSSLQYPILVIIAAVGFFYLLSFIKNKYIKYIIYATYFIFFLNYLFIYLYQYPYYAAESFNFSNHVLSNFLILQRASTNAKIIVFSREPDAQFKNYIFYSNTLNHSSFNQISQAYKDGITQDYIINQIIFARPDEKFATTSTDIIIVADGVNAFSQINRKQQSVIYRLENHQPVFNIYGSNICNNQSLPSLNLSDLNVSPKIESVCKFTLTHEN